jgi:hypothetical protein
VLGEDQFGFRRGKGTRDAIGMMRIISEWTLDIDEDLCACFIDWQKAFDHVNWTKLMQILEETGLRAWIELVMLVSKIQRPFLTQVSWLTARAIWQSHQDRVEQRGQWAGHWLPQMHKTK